MDLAAPHLGYVIIAYAISAVVLVALVAAVAIDLKRQRRAVERLDTAGANPRPRRRTADATEAS